MSRLRQQRQLTIIMVLHDINQAAQFSDRILTMQKGIIVYDDVPLKVINEQMMQDIFNIQVELHIRQQGGHTYPFVMPHTALSN